MSGLHGRQARVVELHGAERLRRQVGDDHVGGGDQLAHDLLALGRMGSSVRPSLLRFICRNSAPSPVVGDRGLEAVLAALALLDADHLGAVLGQQRGAIGPRDVAAEVEHANAFENASHIFTLFALDHQNQRLGL